MAIDQASHAISSAAHRGRYLVHPIYITRVAGEPAAMLDGLGTGETARLVHEISDLRSALIAEGRELAAVLEAAIPGLDPQGIRAALNLKRAMFNGRAIALPDLTRIAALVSNDTHDGIARYGRALAALGEKEASVAATFEQELAQGAPALLAMLSRPNLVAGLSYTNPELLRDFRERLPLNAARTASGKSRRNLEDSLLQYGARTATKTSPLSAFTVLGVDRWGDGGNGLDLAFDPELERRISFKGALFRHLSAIVLADFGRAAALAPLEINPSAQINDQRLQLKAIQPGSLSSGRFWGTGEDRVETANSAILMLITSIFAGHDRQPIAAADLVAAVRARAPKLGEAAVWQFLAKLYQIQYLRPALGTFDQDDAMASYAQLVGRMEGEPGQELHALAIRMQENAAAFQSGDAVNRSRDIGLIQADVRRTCELLGEDAGQPLFKPALFENCYVRATGGSAAWADFADHAADLELLLETATLTDVTHQLRCEFADFFLAEFGPEGICRDVEAFIGKFDDIYKPGRFDIQPGEQRRAPRSEVTSQLLRAVAVFHDYLEPYLRQDSEAHLNHDQLRAVLASVPEAIRNRSLSQSYLLQLGRDGSDRLAVVNQIFGGRSALMSRFLEVLDDAALADVRRYVQDGSDTGLAVELPGVFGFNANHHPRMTDAELGVPPYPPGRADTDRIDLTTTSLAYDPQTHSVHFQTTDGRRFEAFYLGFLIPSLLPSIHRVLSLVSGDGPSQFAIATMLVREVIDQARVTQLPRLRLGSLVLSRRIWLAPFSALPDVNLSPLDFFVAVQSWRAENGFPTEVFVRVIPMPNALAADGTAEAVDWHKFDFKNIKPFYVQLENPRFVRLMQRTLKRNSHAVSITEVLPALADQHVEMNGERHVAELQIELTRAARSAVRTEQDAAHTPMRAVAEGAADITTGERFHDPATIRIAHFDPDRAALLLGPVREAIGLLRSRFAPIKLTLQTHWKFGPHMELDFDGAARANEVVETVRSIVEPWLALHPSTKPLDPVAYLALSAKIGMSELEPGPYVPLLADNSVTAAPYQPSNALPLPELVESKNLFLADALDITLDLLALKAEDESTFNLTLIAMMAICGTTYEPHGLAKGFMSFRSHAEYFFAAYDAQGKLRAKFDALDAANTAQVDNILKAVDGDDPACLPLPQVHRDLLARWVAVVRRTAARNERIVTDNHELLLADTTFDTLVQDVSANAPADFQERALAKETSALGIAFDQEEGLRIRSSVEFMTFRTTVNFFYLILPTLGVSPLQKFCLCHLLANGAQRHFEVDWREIVGLVSPAAVG